MIVEDDGELCPLTDTKCDHARLVNDALRGLKATMDADIAKAPDEASRAKVRREWKFQLLNFMTTFVCARADGCPKAEDE